MAYWTSTGKILKGGGSAQHGVRGCGLAVLIAQPPLVSAHVVQRPGPPQLQEIRTGFCIKYTHNAEVSLPNLVFVHGVITPSGIGAPCCRGYTITLRHATLGRNLIEGWSARRRDLYLSAHSTLTRDRHPFPTGFKPHNTNKREMVDLRLRPRGN